MTIISIEQLTRDMQAHEHQLVGPVGLVPQASDRPLEADDLLFYLSDPSMPMASFMQDHGLFIGDDGLHFDVAQFASIRELAETVIREHAAGKFDGVWKELDLSDDDDVDYDGGYILTALWALEAMYGTLK